ncbi:hypothetical protein [Legionella quinlivanii]|uniref:hypothetical protein n=1 Tax=Legionella quinlivanii TaxID=45073 RepID=UPI0022432AA7|nr:hypothetical protein [Legionella quinlivanii]MCW8450712.1 hypothetical protein [Legionella quinlivanii]
MPRFLNNSQQIINLLSKEFNLDCAAYKNINFKEMKNYKYFSQKKLINASPSDFIPTEKEVKDNPQLLKLITSILFSDCFDFLNFNENIFVSADYFKSKLIEVQNYIQVCHSSLSSDERALKIDAIEFLICQMIGLRLLKEIRERKLELPFEPISRKDAEKDLQALKNIMPKLGTTKKLTLSFNDSFPQTLVGASTSARYMDPFRYAVSNGQRAKTNAYTPLSAWAADNLASFFCGQLRQTAMKARKNAQKVQTAERSLNLSENTSSDMYNFYRLDMHLSCSKIRYALIRKYGVNQYHPLYVGSLIDFLKKEYGYSVESYLDLCMGWGDRMAGAFGASPLGLKRYVGTDPNTELVPAYNEIIANHQPENFQTFTYALPMEALTPAQLCPDGKPNHMMLTSPPYFDKENYPGKQQSHKLYPKYEDWFKNFMIPLISQAQMGLEAGGFIAIEMGSALDRSIDIPGDIDTYLGKCPQLEKLGKFVNTRYHSTPTFLVRYLGSFPLEKPIPVQISENLEFIRNETCVDEFEHKKLTAASALALMSSDYSNEPPLLPEDPFQDDEVIASGVVFKRANDSEDTDTLKKQKANEDQSRLKNAVHLSKFGIHAYRVDSFTSPFVEPAVQDMNSLDQADIQRPGFNV